MKRMKDWKGLAIAAAFLVFGILTQGLALAQVDDTDPDVDPVLLGPCENQIGFYIIPGACEADCVVYCTDPCSAITWPPAICHNIEGPCVRVNQDVAHFMCRDCFCTWPFGGCVDRGLYRSGTATRLVCG